MFSTFGSCPTHVGNLAQKVFALMPSAGVSITPKTNIATGIKNGAGPRTLVHSHDSRYSGDPLVINCSMRKAPVRLERVIL